MKGRSNGAALQVLDELPDDIEQWLEISDKLAPVEITIAVYKWGPEKEEIEIAKEWVKKVRALYYAGGKPSEKVVVGLVADTAVNYRNGEEPRHCKAPFGKKGTKQGIPIRLLQICVGGGHVLLYYSYSANDEKLPKFLIDLLIDTKTIVAGVGMKATEARLEKQYGLTLPRCTDLSGLAAYYDHCYVKPDGYDNFSVMKLADQVYRDGETSFGDHNGIWEDLTGGEKNITFWDENYHPLSDDIKLSDEKVMTGAFQAFLVYDMARKLLSRSPRNRLRK